MFALFTHFGTLDFKALATVVGELPPETQVRLRQFLAGRGEIAAGDRLVLATHRARARTRQRWVLGAPLFLAGAAGALLLFRGRATAS